MVASVSSAPQPMGLLHVSPRDISAALSGIIFAAIPALLAVRRAAQAVERLAATAREELPGTMAAVRLSGMEISDLTMELSDLSHEISQGVRSPARASRYLPARSLLHHSIPPFFISPNCLPVCLLICPPFQPQNLPGSAQTCTGLPSSTRSSISPSLHLSMFPLSLFCLPICPPDQPRDLSGSAQSFTDVPPCRQHQQHQGQGATHCCPPSFLLVPLGLPFPANPSPFPTAPPSHTPRALPRPPPSPLLPDSLKDATVIPIRVVSPLFSSAAGAVGAAASTVGSTVSHVGGTVGAAASHVGGTVGAAASHVGAAASHVGGAAAHIPSVVFNLVDFLPWGHRRGSEGGETGGETNGDTANAHSTAAAKLAAKPAADSAKPSASAAAPADIPGRTNSAAPATKAAAATSASSGAASAGPHSRAPSKPVATGRARPIPSGSSPDQQSPESLHHRPHQPLQPLNSHEFHQLNENQQAHHGSVGSRKAAGAGDTRQEVTVGAAAEEHFELSSLPSLVGWLQHRKDKEKHPRGDAKG
ncbi:unnamed protein product [Closterium sp. NIES-64]|nr:unnamed protein product [Closterium sp. NIES-64]